MKLLLLSLLFFLPLAATQEVTINIKGVNEQISFIMCDHCGQQIDAREDYFMIFDPYSDGEVYYLCEDCSLEYDELYYQSKDECHGK